MKFYCLVDFKVEFDKLKSKKSYRTLEGEIINYFFSKTIDELKTGVRLNHSLDKPYIKKRLGGRGGFRVYFLLIMTKEALYFMYVHPKTGSRGPTNITDESKAYLYKKVLEDIKSDKLYEMRLDNSKQNIEFYKSGKKID